MPLEVGNRYRAAVTAVGSTEKEDGTFGIALSFHTDEGDIDHTVWIESGEFLQYRRKDLKTLGATDDDLVSWEWLQEPSSLVGARCQIVIGDYLGKDGKTHLKVKYINSLRRESTSAKAQAAALLMRKEPEPGPYAVQASSADSGPAPIWQGGVDEAPPF